MATCGVTIVCKENQRVKNDMKSLSCSQKRQNTQRKSTQIGTKHPCMEGKVPFPSARGYDSEILKFCRKLF